MDHIHSNTFDDVHTSGRHLPLEERDMIQALHRRGAFLSRHRCRGHKAYAKDRKNSRKPCKIDHGDCEPFIQWMVERVRLECWSLDACVGYASLFFKKLI